MQDAQQSGSQESNFGTSFLSLMRSHSRSCDTCAAYCRFFILYCSTKMVKWSNSTQTRNRLGTSGQQHNHESLSILSCASYFHVNVLPLQSKRAQSSRTMEKMQHLNAKNT